MARTCSVCASPHRRAIDEGLVEGAALARLAKIYGLSERALRRHRDAHLPAPSVEAREQAERQRGDDLLERARAAERVVWETLQRARAERDGRTVLAAVDRVLRGVETEARLRGELRDHQPVVIHLNVPLPLDEGDPDLPPVFEESDFEDGTYQRWAAAHGDAEGARWRPGDAGGKAPR